MKELFKNYCASRLCKISTVIGLIVLYMLIFQHVIVDEFVKYLFLVALEQLINNIVSNDSFITAIVGSMVGWLVYTKKF